MLTAPFTLSSRYYCDRVLGRGGFSEVWHATDEGTRQEVAVKVFLRQDERGQELCKEEFVRTMRIHHPHIIRLLDFGTHEGMPYIVMPFLAKGTPQDRAGHLPENELWRIAADVAAALEHIHGMNPVVIHNDLKPDNILTTDDDRFLLTDFGISMELFERLSQQVERASGEGPRPYRAPETFHFGDSRRRQPVKATDMWSFGACMFELASGEPPFGEQGGLYQLMRYKDTGAGVSALVEPLPGHLSGRFTDMVYRCLDCETWNRPTAAQVRQNAQDWLRGYAFGEQPQGPTVIAPPRPVEVAAARPVVHRREVVGKNTLDRRLRSTMFLTIFGVLGLLGIGYAVYYIFFEKEKMAEVQPVEIEMKKDEVSMARPVDNQKESPEKDREEGFKNLKPSSPTAIPPAGESADLIKMKFIWEKIDAAIMKSDGGNVEDRANRNVLSQLKIDKASITAGNICDRLRILNSSRPAVKELLEYANENFKCGIKINVKQEIESPKSPSHSETN